MVSPIERCKLYLYTIKRYFYETMTVNTSVLMNSVCYREVSAIKHVSYRGSIVKFSEVALYCIECHAIWSNPHKIIFIKRTL